MTLLAPAGLLAVLLLAIPVLIHLFKPRKMQATPFSSLRWLEQSPQRLSRRIEWHQWLLFLARAGTLLLLAFALARPLLGGGSNAAADRILVIDAGRRMAGNDAENVWESSLDLIEHRVARPRPGDRWAVISVGSRPNLRTSWTADPSAAIAALRGMKPEQVDANFAGAFPLIRSLVADGDSARPLELTFVTANARSSWRQSDVQAFAADLSRPAKATVIETASSVSGNAWIDHAFVASTGQDELAVIVAIGGAGPNLTERTVRMAGVPGAEEATQSVTPVTGSLRRVAFRLPPGKMPKDAIAEIRLEPADAIPSDDRRFLPLGSEHGAQMLAIVADEAGSDGRPISTHLRAAFDALAISRPNATRAIFKTPEALTIADLDRAQVVVLASDLSPGLFEHLEKRIREGMGAAVFLGPNLTPAFMRDRLQKAAQPSDGMMPFAPSDVVTAAKPASLTEVQWSHPILAPLQDAALGDWTRDAFRRYVGAKGEYAASGRVLARYDGGIPAITEQAIGDGRVILFNTSVNDAWSDLPRRPAFVPLIDRLVSYLGADAPQTLDLGDAASISLREVPTGSKIVAVAPSGKKHATFARSEGKSVRIRIDDLDEIGIWRLTADNEATLRSFAVQGKPASDLATMDAATLQAWFGATPVEIVTASDLATRPAGRSAWALSPWLIVAAALLFAVETVYASRLCPRRNDAKTGSSILGRGLLRPSTKEA